MASTTSSCLTHFSKLIKNKCRPQLTLCNRSLNDVIYLNFSDGFIKNKFDEFTYTRQTFRKDVEKVAGVPQDHTMEVEGVLHGNMIRKVRDVGSLS